jgi:hypothetical protein
LNDASPNKRAQLRFPLGYGSLSSLSPAFSYT